MNARDGATSRTTQSGIVLSTSRRMVEIKTPQGQVVNGKTSSQALEAAVGDLVEYQIRGNDTFVTKLLPRKNSLLRWYRDEERILATNLDHLLLISATTTLFQPFFIDRVLTLCFFEDIACSLVINKQDLGMGDERALVETYSTLGYRVILSSVPLNQGTDEIRSILSDPALSIVALAGISGVGKSSLFNSLMRSSQSKTAEVSATSGQGRQTTSQARGYVMPRENIEDLILVDLPGVQNFGVKHLEKSQIRHAFSEFAAAPGHCEYQDCIHLAEQNCAVKRALEKGTISTSRYESYKKIMEEITQGRKY